MDIEGWSGTANGNNASPPNGFPENMDFSDLNNAARETMAATKRFQDRLFGTKQTAGTSAALTLTHDTAPASYTTGQRYSARAHTANAAGATLNVNSLGAVAIYKQGSTQLGVLASADIQSGAAFEVMYDGAGPRFHLMTPPGTGGVPPGAVTSSGLTMSTARLLGRITASTGAVEELQVDSTLSMSGSTLGSAWAIATQAQIEGGSFTTALVTPARQQFHPSAVKAWVKFDNAASIGGNYNCSSVVDGGTASWSPQWDTDFSSVNYAVLSSIAYTSGNFNRMSAIRAQVAGAVTIETFSTGGNDESNVGAIYSAAFGDQ